jgi:GNAT superfamily N-acetyltransferase
VWGVHDGHLLAGMLAVSRRFNVHVGNHLWLWGLYVRPRYRGTPASRLLMDAMLAWCKVQSEDECLLASCQASSQRAMLFLSRWGFHVVPVTSDLRGIMGVDAGSVLVERERD